MEHTSKHIFHSPVYRKILTSVSGLALTGFIVVHLIGNLTLFGDETLFNRYAYTLESMGIVLYLLEIVLLVIVSIHIYLGVSISLHRRKARKNRYRYHRSKKGPSHYNMSSKNMIITGLILILFLIIHIKMFKYGEAQMVNIDGIIMRDLRSLVIDAFQDPINTFFYTFVMVMLIFHLHHGIWSAFISMTLRNKKYVAYIYIFSIISAILLGLGYLFIPLFIFFNNGL